jgi:hypothetical protein
LCQPHWRRLIPFSSPVPPLLGSTSSCPCAVSCFLPLRQDQLAASTSSFGNASSHRLSSWVETKAMNQHHHCRPPSPNRSTLTIHCYKKSYLNLSHSFYNSTASLFCLLPSHSSKSSELYLPPSFPFTIILCISSLHTTTHTVIN